jgi:hypothetical protein
MHIVKGENYENVTRTRNENQDQSQEKKTRSWQEKILKIYLFGKYLIKQIQSGLVLLTSPNKEALK